MMSPIIYISTRLIFLFIFKKVTRYTFKNYITKLRIEKAKELLLYST